MRRPPIRMVIRQRYPRACWSTLECRPPRCNSVRRTTLSMKVPETGANNSIARGNGSLLLNGAETSAEVGLQFQNLGSAEISAHIHSGAVGVAGPILFTLAPPIVNPIVNMSISPTVQQVADLK